MHPIIGNTGDGPRPERVPGKRREIASMPNVAENELGREAVVQFSSGVETVVVVVVVVVVVFVML